MLTYLHGLAALSSWPDWLFLLSFFVSVLFMLATVAGAAVHGDGDGGIDLDGDGHPDIELGGWWRGWAPEAQRLRVPISIPFAAFTLGFGSAGLLLNRVMPVWAFPAVLLLAWLTGALTARGVLAALTAILPASDSDARAATEHLGRYGMTITSVDARVGQVRLTDSADYLAVATRDGAPTIPANVHVLVVAYARERHVYLVEPTPEIL